MGMDPLSLPPNQTSIVMRLYTFVGLLLFLTGCHTQQPLPIAPPPNSTFLLVRHAEKATGDDPLLTPAGEARAQALANLLDSMQIDAIYASDFRRTQLTAAPVAQAKGLVVRPYDPKALEAFAAMLKAQHAGQTVLIVGHSNTTPYLAGLLQNITPYPDFDESDYGNLLIVTTSGQAQGSLVRLRF